MHFSCLLLISMLFIYSQADPDPDTHLHVHLPPEDDGGQGKAPKIGAGELNPRAGDYDSGQTKAGPTQSALTTVPSIRNEMDNENSELYPHKNKLLRSHTTIRTNCGGHISLKGCFGCPDRAPNKRSRPYYCNGQCKWIIRSRNDGECKDSQQGVNCGDHQAPSCGACYGAISLQYGPIKLREPNNFARSQCNGDCDWECTDTELSFYDFIVDTTCVRYQCRPKSDNKGAKDEVMKPLGLEALKQRFQ